MSAQEQKKITIIIDKYNNKNTNDNLQSWLRVTRQRTEDVTTLFLFNFGIPKILINYHLSAQIALIFKISKTGGR